MAHPPSPMVHDATRNNESSRSEYPYPEYEGKQKHNPLYDLLYNRPLHPWKVWAIHCHRDLSLFLGDTYAASIALNCVFRILYGQVHFLLSFCTLLGRELDYQRLGDAKYVMDERLGSIDVLLVLAFLFLQSDEKMPGRASTVAGPGILMDGRERELVLEKLYRYEQNRQYLKRNYGNVFQPGCDYTPLRDVIQIPTTPSLSLPPEALSHLHSSAVPNLRSMLGHGSSYRAAVTPLQLVFSSTAILEYFIFAIPGELESDEFIYEADDEIEEDTDDDEDFYYDEESGDDLYVRVFGRDDEVIDWDAL